MHLEFKHSHSKGFR